MVIVPKICETHSRIDFRNMGKWTRSDELNVVEDLFINTVDGRADAIDSYNDDDTWRK